MSRPSWQRLPRIAAFLQALVQWCTLVVHLFTIKTAWREEERKGALSPRQGAHVPHHAASAASEQCCLCSWQSFMSLPLSLLPAAACHVSAASWSPPPLHAHAWPR